MNTHADTIKRLRQIFRSSGAYLKIDKDLLSGAIRIAEEISAEQGGFDAKHIAQIARTIYEETQARSHRTANAVNALADVLDETDSVLDEDPRTRDIRARIRGAMGDIGRDSSWINAEMRLVERALVAAEKKIDLGDVERPALVAALAVKVYLALRAQLFRPEED